MVKLTSEIALLVLIGALVAASCAARAQVIEADQAGGGGVSCVEYTREVAKLGDNYRSAMFAWAEGFMTGVDLAEWTHHDAEHNLASIPREDQETIVDAYCREHPTAQYIAAVLELFSKMDILNPSLHAGQ